MGLYIQNGTNFVDIEVRDDLRHPEYAWPLTRLSSAVTLPAGIATVDDLRLVDQATGKAVPCQFTDLEIEDAFIRQATVHFLADMPSGGQYTFRLAANPSLPAPSSALRIMRDADGITLDNGKMKVLIPGTSVAFDSPRPSVQVPTPVMRLGKGERWFGKGVFAIPGLVTRYSVEELSVGAVMAEYRVTYYFHEGQSYAVTLRLTAEMDFIELDEAIEGFTAQDGAAWEMYWDGLDIAYRFSPNRPDRPINKDDKGYTNYQWQKVDERLGPNGMLPNKIAPYHNWMTWWRVPTAVYWDARGETSVGVFITEMDRWDDREYALWGSKDRLCIHFYYNDGCLRWQLPLVAGTRSIGMAAYPHQVDIDRVNEINKAMLHVDDLHRWYGWVSLSKVMSWVLDFDESLESYPKFFVAGNGDFCSTPEEIDRLLYRRPGSIINSTPNATERSAGGTSPVSSRECFKDWTPAFDTVAPQMTPEQRRHFQAAYVFMSYLYMDEALMPMKRMLSGHPNFLADVKGIPGMTAFLFPHHPEAQGMADHFEKFLALNLKYHVRPNVSAWDALGGRWTENLGCYTWAAVNPMLRPSYLLHHHFDGRNRILQPNISPLANWILNCLTAPFEGAGGKRVLPPQGAHSRGIPPANGFRALGQELFYYDPLLAEQILWATSADDEPFEARGNTDPWFKIVEGEWKSNRGTNPHFTSKKFTGYGYVLRAAVNTPQEVSVHLQQIDEGPNYRWGRAGKGGNGVIYFFAAGKRYSHNGHEDVGDAPRGDVERCTNFGVKKPGGYRCLGDYRCIGRNELTEPLYDFSFAQYAQVNGGPEALPEYQSRSVLVSGADYMVIFDDVATGVEGRLSWFVGTEDDFPHIHQLKPGADFQDAQLTAEQSNYHKDPEVLPTKGRYYDGAGSFLTVVSHRAEVSAKATDYGCLVTRPDGVDYVFRTSETVDVALENGVAFRGTAGIIRQCADGQYEAALFHGDRVSVPGITAEIDGYRAGISLTPHGDGYIGDIHAPNGATIRLSGMTAAGYFLYLDGQAVEVQADGATIVLSVAPGKYRWQWTAGAVQPMATRVLRTENIAAGFTAYWQPVTGAVSYDIELSEDGGASWQAVGCGISGTDYMVSGLANGRKVHVRVIANGATESASASPEYPVYVTEQAPHCPEGLLVKMRSGVNTLTWGEILGAGEYRLYRRAQGTEAFTPVYAGLQCEYRDTDISDGVIYEYRVTAVNGNGESQPSPLTDTDPARLINWDPKPDEGFRRDTESHENGYPEYNNFIEERMPILHYPDEGAPAGATVSAEKPVPETVG